MAWSSELNDGGGAGNPIISHPVLVHKIEITPDSTTATAVNHGGPGVPDMIIVGHNSQANPTATEVSVTASSATQITVDVEGTGARPVIYCIWRNQVAP